MVRLYLTICNPTHRFWGKEGNFHFFAETLTDSVSLLSLTCFAGSFSHSGNDTIPESKKIVDLRKIQDSDSAPQPGKPGCSC